jgi:hypothetical protein
MPALRSALSFVLAVCALGLSPTRHAGAATQKRKAEKEIIKTEYDHSKDVTTVMVYPFIALREQYDDPFERTTLTAGFTYSGQALTSGPATVDLGVVSMTSSGWQFDKPERRPLSAEIDGEKLDLGTMERLRFTTETHNPNQVMEFTVQYYVESLGLHVPAESFLKIANGKKVSIRVGKYKYGLGREDLEALRELAGRMKP